MQISAQGRNVGGETCQNDRKLRKNNLPETNCNILLIDLCNNHFVLKNEYSTYHTGTVMIN